VFEEDKEYKAEGLVGEVKEHHDEPGAFFLEVSDVATGERLMTQRRGVEKIGRDLRVTLVTAPGVTVHKRTGNWYLTKKRSRR
jgi:hypothetical protein